MKSLERLFWIIITVGLAIFTFTRNPDILTKTEVVPGDPVIIEVPIPYDSLIYIDTGSYDVDTLWLRDTLFLPTDTAAILADYFKMRSYDSIPIQNDSSMTIYAKAKVTQNTLFEFTGFAKNNRQTTIINNYQQESYFGIGAVLRANIIAPYASYQRKQHEIGVGYELNNKAFIFKYEYKFPLKRKLWQHLMK